MHEKSLIHFTNMNRLNIYKYSVSDFTVGVNKREAVGDVARVHAEYPVLLAFMYSQVLPFLSYQRGGARLFTKIMSTPARIKMTKMSYK